MKDLVQSFVRIAKGRPLRVTFIALAFAFALSCGSPEEDEIAILKLVKKAARLAEEHDLGGILELTGEEFEADPGKVDRRETKRILWMAFRHYGELEVMYPRPSVDLESEGRGASVTVPFLIVRKGQTFPDLREFYNDPQGWAERVGDRADLYRLLLELTQRDGAWLVQRATLQRFSGLGFRE